VPKIQFLRGVGPCRLLNTYHYLWRRSCFKHKSLSVQEMLQEQLRRSATLPELLDLANGGSTLLRNVCTVHVYQSPRHSISKEMNCHWWNSYLYATQRSFFLRIILELRKIWISFAEYKPNLFSKILYSRHVKLRVPRGPYWSHLCCHEGHTRQLTEVI